MLGREIKNSAGRSWSESYLNLTRNGKPNPIVNWHNVQSGPPMLAPYSAGAAKSGLIKMLRKTHYEVQLGREELEKIACWIDLLVPYCGDYREANTWSDSDVAKYERFAAKRQAMEAIEAGEHSGIDRETVAARNLDTAPGQRSGGKKNSPTPKPTPSHR